MKKSFIAYFCIASLLIVCCGKSGAPPALEGAWLGEGTFSAGAGELAVKAQLEILSDGSYRFLILEPGIMAMMGLESGKWIREGRSLTLQPKNEKSGGTEKDASVISKLRQSSPENLRVKKLVIAEGLSSLQLIDGPLNIEFKPNLEARRKLKEAGEIN